MKKRYKICLNNGEFEYHTAAGVAVVEGTLYLINSYNIASGILLQMDIKVIYAAGAWKSIVELYEVTPE